MVRKRGREEAKPNRFPALKNLDIVYSGKVPGHVEEGVRFFDFVMFEAVAVMLAVRGPALVSGKSPVSWVLRSEDSNDDPP